MIKRAFFPRSEDQLSIQIQDETRERQRKEKLRNHLVSIGIAGFRISDTSVKHRNIDHKNARRGNLVVVDVRLAKNTDDCVLGPWEKQYLIGVINKRQRTGPNLPEDDLTITLYEPWKVYDGLPSMPLWASIKIEGDDRDEHPIDSIADMQNMGNRPPIVALGKEGIGRWKNGKGENETWGKGGIRCHILNILVQHGWPC